MELLRTTVQLREESPPYELPLTNFSCKTKKMHLTSNKGLQTYVSLENNIIVPHFPKDSARSTGTSPKLKQHALSPVLWQQPRAACWGFKGGFIESWCLLVTIRSLSSEKDIKKNFFSSFRHCYFCHK